MCHEFSSSSLRLVPFRISDAKMDEKPAAYIMSDINEATRAAGVANVLELQRRKEAKGQA